MSGRAEEGIRPIEKAMRLNPIPPSHYLLWLGYAYYHLGQYKDVIEASKMVLKRSPNNLFAHIQLVGAYSASGRDEEARQQAEEVLRVDPAFSVEKYEETLPIKDRAEAERFITDLRMAGLK
jgi:adenylate cyclase